MVIVGLDIGYSNLKIAAGDAGGVPQVLVRPAGAAPAQRLGERVGSGPAPADGIYVDVRGQRWIAAVVPGRLEGWQRPLHEDYAASPAYEALVKAGLVLADYRRIDQLVTGLPVSQAREPRRREALTRLLVGRHATDHGEVEDEAVRIIPQPVGAFVDLMWSAPDAALLERIETGTVLVLGAGYYSVDWAVIVGGELRRGASGTSLEADVGADRPGRGADRRAARPGQVAAERMESKPAVALGPKDAISAALNLEAGR